MSKTRNRLFRCFVIFISIVLLTMARPLPIRAASSVNVTLTHLSTYSSAKYFKSLKKRIGGMTVKKNRKYPVYYASGNKMILGLNNHPDYDRHENYIFVQNTGNKSVKFLGVKIGMTSSTAKLKLTANGFRRLSATLYASGEAGILKLSMKNSKVTGWKYSLSPTS